MTLLVEVVKHSESIIFPFGKICLPYALCSHVLPKRPKDELILILQAVISNSWFLI
jgi:hypothetical protein